MKQLSGRAVSPGFAEGTAVPFDSPGDIDFPRYDIPVAEANSEVSRFREALERSCRELQQIERRVLNELGASQSSIFSAHLGLLRDKQFVERVAKRIRDNMVNAEQALDIEIAELTRLIKSMENEYLRERAQDIRDISRRLMKQLLRNDLTCVDNLPSNAIIVAHELLPSETIDLDRRHVAGIVTEEGGENSHAAILARALGIPAVTGVAGVSQIPSGARLLVDGQQGQVTIAPTKSIAMSFSESKERYDGESLIATRAENLQCVTSDGVHVSLLANINRPDEALMIAEHHLEGVGLFRTEFMYMDAIEPPSFERQLETYQTVIRKLEGRPLTIRTLDLGGDKVPMFLAAHYEANPNLGSRGLRLSFTERELFETQIRAILTASKGREEVRVLLPMVLGPSDLAEADELIRRLSNEIGVEQPISLGAMIETPASLFALEEIFEIADFACIGTNDLTQFILAADRNSFELADDYSVLHPSALRAIAKVIEAGHQAGREVCVCGEAASYPRTAGLLVGLGIRQLSMSPLRAARVRFYLRQSSVTQLDELARQALQSRSTAEVLQAMQGLLPHSSTIGSANKIGSAIQDK